MEPGVDPGEWVVFGLECFCEIWLELLVRGRVGLGKAWFDCALLSGCLFGRILLVWGGGANVSEGYNMQMRKRDRRGSLLFC